MSTNAYRGALIGCGFFARNHMHAWAALDRVEIAAVCDRDAARAEAMARDFGARAYTDAAEMLARERLDFVDIATQAPAHRPLVALAARNGLAAICQKPFAETLEDAQAMAKASAEAGKPLLVHENFRWQRPFREAARLIEEDAIGAITFAHFSFRHGYDNYVNQPYLAEIERFTIMDVGLHLFDLARCFLGDAESLFCRTQRINPRVRGEDAFHASLRHTSGACSVVDVSFESKFHPEPFPQTTARIEGRDGTIEILRDYRLLLHRPGSVQEIDVRPQTPAWGESQWAVVQESVAAIEAHWRDVLDGAAEPQPSGADNVKTLALALAAYESAEKGISIQMEGK